MSGAEQIVDRAELKKMSPAAIVKAHEAGRLDALKSGADIRRGADLSAAQWQTIVSSLSDDELVKADEAGLLDPLHAQAGTTVGSADQGARGAQAPRTAAGMRAELRTLTAEEIVERHRDGRLDALMKGEVA